jgi:DNA-directed RNA polymerase subunit beta'
MASTKKTNPLKSLYTADFDAVSLKLASPDRILEWSHGEVTKPETINYRTQRSEKNGLFDEKIFGPEKDYECYCGKYRGIRYKGIVCEKCGVEVTRAIVRRERMGHIELATPVSHIWFLRSVPSRMATILGVKASDLEKVIYFAGFIITEVDQEEKNRILKELDNEYKIKLKSLKEEKSKEKLKEVYLSTKREIESLQPGVIIEDTVYNTYYTKYGAMFEAGIGAEAIYEIFQNLDIEKLGADLQKEYDESRSKAQQARIKKRLSIVQSMVQANIRPEWMFLSRIPVLPPALRPMVALEGGRHATSDVNDLYRRVINRNNRLKKLIAINAPHVILRNEKRIMQEAVDALIDNSIRRGSSSFSANSAQRRPLKSLSDNLKGKQGIFRQNLLGKRVDYSGRSVIVVGPDLALDECGIPKHMALELFRPFVISKLIEQELAYNIRGANRLIDEGADEVWAILERVIKDKYVLLNRAPTLHRLGIQAFRPRLIEGNAIQVHPLVCTAFNADFDGDQMAVHVPLSDEAQAEAREFMAANKNILKPGTGRPVVSGKMLDIVLGCYWMTTIVEGKNGEGSHYPSPNHAITAFDFGQVDFRARIKVLPTDSPKYAEFDGKIFETSVGRLLFNSVLPKDFPYLNEEIDSHLMQTLVDRLIDTYGIEGVPSILDKIKAFGFEYATYAGITWGLGDIQIPEGKDAVIAAARAEADQINEHFAEGLLSEDERFRKSIELWQRTKGDVEALIPDTLAPNGSVADMINSGARGSLKQITVMAGMKGLINNNKGEIIDFPILTSSKEGHTPIEYFITTHGSRKGLTDTALNTARAGYLTRRLFDVSQDVVITEEDCGTNKGIVVREEKLGGITVPISRNIKGRYLADTVKNAEGDIIHRRNDFLTRDDADAIEAAGIESVIVRSPMTCETLRGVCQKCYGMDLGTNEPIALGEAVGTVAAQAIGEPGTQLTMRTFHSGGTAQVGGDIVSGLPRVEEIVERRSPKSKAVVATVSGTVSEIKDNGRNKTIVVVPDLTDRKKTTKKKDTESVEYSVHFRRMPLVNIGDEVKKGQLLTDGSADLRELFKYAGQEVTQNYIIHEIGKIYELQGASISRKHIEIIVKQMFSRVRVKSSGDTTFSIGDIVEVAEAARQNSIAREEGGEEAKLEPLVLGVTEISLSRDSFLSAASFQHTNRILINAAVRGSVDRLEGLKENVILGRLIPAGSGFTGSPKYDLIHNMEKHSHDGEDEGEKK